MQGEYGLQDISFGATVQLGRRGVERVIEYDLEEDEKDALEKSADSVRSTIEALRALGEI